MKKVFWIFLALSACASGPQHPAIPIGQAKSEAATACTCTAPTEAPPIQIPDVERYAGPAITKPGEPSKSPEFKLLQTSTWESIDGFGKDNLVGAWGALLHSCSVLKKNAQWRSACEAILSKSNPSGDEASSLLREHFQPWQASKADGSTNGLITGYYEPLLRGNRIKTDRYRYPLYSRPDDLVTVELASLYPELANRRLRGRLQDGKLTPYFSRGEIEIRQSPLAGKELLWVDDILDLFFLQIQGSGMVLLESGEQLHIGYADQNGQP